ncbi:MAG: STAS domain-containing protein [Actinomycetes bacterium]
MRATVPVPAETARTETVGSAPGRARRARSGPGGWAPSATGVPPGASTDGVSVSDTVSLAVAGPLDAQAGARLVEAVDEALSRGCTRVEIDLAEVAGFDESGSRALATCIDRGRALDQGVTVHVDSASSRQAFLACLTRV